MQDGEVWLTQDGIAQLFDVDRSVVTKHLKNIFQDGELAEKETRAKFTQVADNGKPINIIQDKNYQSDFDRLMAETAETKLNTTRISNFFVEIRVVSYLKSLAIQGFPFFCVWLMCIGKHQNCEDVFIRRHRYMNTAFRYSYLDMLLQMLAVSCISAFDGGEPRCKSEYTHPHSSENAVQKCIRAGRPPLF